MRYRIVAAQSWQDLENEVNKCLDQGWTLQGGVAATSHSYHNAREGYDESTWEYSQAMLQPVSESAL